MAPLFCLMEREVPARSACISGGNDRTTRSTDLGAQAGLYANRRDGGGLHQRTVSQMRCNLWLFAPCIAAQINPSKSAGHE